MFPHPAARILLWGFAAVALQRLAAPGLLGATLLMAVALERAGLAEFLRLLRRSRWLLLILATVYALVPMIGGAAPAGQAIYPDIAGGALQAARLVLTLGLLALLLATTPMQALVAGLHRMSLPLHRIGLDPDRLAIRIGLTLHYCASVRPSSTWRHWGRELGGVSPQPVRLPQRPAPMGPADVAAVAAGAAVTVATLVF